MSKVIRILGAAISTLVLVSCAHMHPGEHKHSHYIRDGVLKNGIHQQAFLDVWGPPDRTTAAETAESISAQWGGFGGSFYSRFRLECG
jgi:hypothetical protein